MSKMYESQMYVTRQLHLMQSIGIFPEFAEGPPAEFGTPAGQRYIELTVKDWDVGAWEEAYKAAANSPDFSTSFQTWLAKLSMPTNLEHE